MGIVGSEVEGNGLMSVCRRQMTLETQLSTESGQRKQNQMWVNFWKGIGLTKLMRQHFVFWLSLHSTKSKTLASLHMCFKQPVKRETKPAMNQGTVSTATKQTPFGTQPHPCILQRALGRRSHGVFCCHETPSTWLKAGVIPLCKPQWAPSGLSVHLSLL